MRYDETSGELSVITFTEPLPGESSLKYLLAEERAKHPVRRLTFVFSNARAEEHLHWLRKNRVRAVRLGVLRWLDDSILQGLQGQAVTLLIHCGHPTISGSAMPFSRRGF